MTPDYVDDIAYPHHFHREMTPAWLDAVLRGLGRPRPNPLASLRWCELGCGLGLNALVCAATNPSIHVTAIDGNAAQLQRLQGDADSAGINNIDLVQADFANLDTFDPQGEGFDVIVTHGVLSWISPVQRQAVLRFMQRRLRPGGLVYAHYMTHPGLSAAAATQRLVRRVAAAQPGHSAQRAQAGLEMLLRLDQAGAGHFIASPQERPRLAAARQQDPAALAHELLPAHWEPFHVGDMMDAFAAIGCDYIGSATPIDNIDAVSLPAATRPMLAGVPDAATAETIRDIARNQSYRRDLYQKGGQPLRPAEHMAALLSLKIAPLPGTPRSGGLTFNTPIGPVQGEEAVFGPLLAALARQPQSVEALSRLHRHPLHPALLNQAVQMLLWAQLVHPLTASPAPPEAAWRLNRRLAEAGVAGHLLAPALGTALPAGVQDMAMAAAVLANPSIGAGALRERFGQPAEAWHRMTRPGWVALGVLPG